MAMLESVKAWFKARNRQGKYMGLRSVWRAAKNVHEFHPSERARNYVTVKWMTTLGRWSPLELPPEIIRRRFYCCIVNAPTGKRVVKLPLGIDAFSCGLIQALKAPEVLERYRAVLTGLKEDPWL